MALTKTHNRMIDGASANVKDFGALGDNSADDTTAIRSALASGAKSIYFPSGTYIVNPDVGDIFPLTSVDGLHIFGDDATIKSIAGAGDYGANTFKFTDCDNVLIERLTIDCNKANQTGGYNAIAIFGGDHITIRDCILLNAKQDGIYIRGSSPGTESTYPDNILIDNVYIDAANRNGLSVIGAKSIRVLNSSFMNTYGESPSAGIDFEPNSSDPYGIRNAVISNCRFEGNDGYGCVITGNSNDEAWTRELIISDVIFRNNGLNAGGFLTDTGELYISRGKNITVNGFLCDSNVEFLSYSLKVGRNPERVQLSNLYFADISHSDNTRKLLDIDSHAEDIRTVNNMYATNCNIIGLAFDGECTAEGIYLSDVTGEHGITLSGDEVILKDVMMLRSNSITSTSASTIESVTMIDSISNRPLRIRGNNSTYKNITIKNNGTATNAAVWLDDSAGDLDNCVLDGFHIWDSGGYWDTLANVYVIDQASVTGNHFRNMIPSPLSGAAVWNPASIAAGSSLSTTVSILRGDTGDRCITTHSVSLQGLISFASVTSANTATVTLFNPTGGAIDLASHTVTVEAIK